MLGGEPQHVAAPPACARRVSANPVVYAELPRTQLWFDLVHSIRFEIVVNEIEAFTVWVRSRSVATGAEVGRSATGRPDQDR